MNKTGAFAMLALVNGFLLLSVACAPEVPPPPSKTDSDLTGPKKSTPAGSSSTPAPSASAPTGTNGAGTGDDNQGGEETEDPNEAANQAKFLQCVSQNPAAKALADTRTACFEACEDDACEARCEPCTADEATCNIVFQCEEQAFPDTGDGEEGEGNED
jgi:hypothetical protein